MSCRCYPDSYPHGDNHAYQDANITSVHSDLDPHEHANQDARARTQTTKQACANRHANAATKRHPDPYTHLYAASYGDVCTHGNVDVHPEPNGSTYARVKARPTKPLCADSDRHPDRHPDRDPHGAIAGDKHANRDPDSDADGDSHRNRADLDAWVTIRAATGPLGAERNGHTDSDADSDTYPYPHANLDTDARSGDAGGAIRTTTRVLCTHPHGDSHPHGDAAVDEHTDAAADACAWDTHVDNDPDAECDSDTDRLPK